MDRTLLVMAIAINIVVLSLEMLVASTLYARASNVYSLLESKGIQFDTSERLRVDQMIVSYMQPVHLIYLLCMLQMILLFYLLYRNVVAAQQERK